MGMNLAIGDDGQVLAASLTDTQTPSEARQAWLEAAIRAMRPLFASKCRPLPDALRVSIGWSSLGKRALGACYSTEASSDAHREIFISPVEANGDEILGTLAHELCHAALPYGHGHDKVFTELGRSIGLVGKPTHLGAGGPAFKWWCDTFVAANGAYPAGAIAQAKREKQATAMIKVECLDCGYVARTTRKWLESVGAPICPCNHETMEIC